MRADELMEAGDVAGAKSLLLLSLQAVYATCDEGRLSKTLPE